MEAYQNHCRLCLGSEVVEYKLYGPETYSCVVKDYFGIELKQTVGWPLNACGECIRILWEMQELKKKIQTTQGKLVQLNMKSAMAKRSPKDPKEIEFVDPELEDVQEDKFSIPGIKIPDEDDNELDTPEDEVINSSSDVLATNTRRTNTHSSSLKRKFKEIEEESEEDAPEEDTEWDANEELYGLSDTEERSSSSSKKKKSQQKDLTWNDHYDEMMANLGVLKCNQCSKDHTKYQQLVTHMRARHSRAPDLICCGVAFRKYELLDHLRYHQDKTTFTCRVCKREFLCGSRLRIHEVGKHQIGDSRFQCDQCQRKFASNMSLVQHMKVHSGEREEFSCKQCDKVYKTTSGLLVHVKRDHEEIRLFVCDICGKSFALKCELQKHFKNHEKRKLEQCDICLKYYSSVLDHKARIHDKKEDVHCPICDKMVSAQYFKLHTKTYHGEKKEMPCTVCEKMFHTTKALKQHMDLHLGVVYPCRVCGREFGNNGNRTKHERAKHPEDYERLAAEREAKMHRAPTEERDNGNTRS